MHLGWNPPTLGSPRGSMDSPYLQALSPPPGGSLLRDSTRFHARRGCIWVARVVVLLSNGARQVLVEPDPAFREDAPVRLPAEHGIEVPEPLRGSSRSCGTGANRRRYCGDGPAKQGLRVVVRKAYLLRWHSLGPSSLGVGRGTHKAGPTLVMAPVGDGRRSTRQQLGPWIHGTAAAPPDPASEVCPRVSLGAT